MKKIKLYIIILFSIPHLVLANRGDKTTYYLKAFVDRWGDYTYNQPVEKEKLQQTPYYEVNYDGTVILDEKHYNSEGNLIYVGEFHYQGEGYSKYEINFKKAEIKIKYREPETNYYSKVKYLKFFGYSSKERKTIKFEEYHTNGKVWLASYYNSQETLEKQEEFYRSGDYLSIRYYKIIHGQNLIWKMDVYNEEGQYTGYWEYFYDKEAKETDKKFHKSKTSGS